MVARPGLTAGYVRQIQWRDVVKQQCLLHPASSGQLRPMHGAPMLWLWQALDAVSVLVWQQHKAVVIIRLVYCMAWPMEPLQCTGEEDTDTNTSLMGPLPLLMIHLYCTIPSLLNQVLYGYEHPRPGGFSGKCTGTVHHNIGLMFHYAANRAGA